MTRRRGKKNKKTAQVMEPVASESPYSQHPAEEVDDELEKAKKELKDVQKELMTERENHEMLIIFNNEERTKLILEEKQLELNWLLDNFHHGAKMFDMIIASKQTKETVQDLELKLQILEDEEDQEATLRMEQETTDRLKERNEKLKEALKNNLEIKPWKECQICFQEFGVDGDMVPRFLQCGHTICSACLRKLMKPTYIKCPIDGAFWRSSTAKTIDDFPKNYKALDM